MPSLYSYLRVIDAVTTHSLRLPEPAAGQASGQTNSQELATLPDGRTIVAVSGTLPANQPSAIAASLQALPTPLPDDLRRAICAASPQVRLINNRVQLAIAERYSMADEIKLLRTAPSAEAVAYNAYAEDCRAWGRAEKAKLGL